MEGPLDLNKPGSSGMVNYLSFFMDKCDTVILITVTRQNCDIAPKSGDRAD